MKHLFRLINLSFILLVLLIGGCSSYLEIFEQNYINYKVKIKYNTGHSYQPPVGELVSLDSYLDQAVIVKYEVTSLKDSQQEFSYSDIYLILDIGKVQPDVVNINIFRSHNSFSLEGIGDNTSFELVYIVPISASIKGFEFYGHYIDAVQNTKR